jgi:hypothetical protein
LQVDSMEDFDCNPDELPVYKTSGKLQRLEVDSISFSVLATLPDHVLYGLSLPANCQSLEIVATPAWEVIGFESRDPGAEVSRATGAKVQCCWGQMRCCCGSQWPTHGTASCKGCKACQPHRLPAGVLLSEATSDIPIMT